MIHDYWLLGINWGSALSSAQNWTNTKQGSKNIVIDSKNQWAQFLLYYVICIFLSRNLSRICLIIDSAINTIVFLTLHTIEWKVQLLTKSFIDRWLIHWLTQVKNPLSSDFEPKILSFIFCCCGAAWALSDDVPPAPEIHRMSNRFIILYECDFWLVFNF